jgi:hypothetical protein
VEGQLWVWRAGVNVAELVDQKHGCVNSDRRSFQSALNLSTGEYTGLRPAPPNFKSFDWLEKQMFRNTPTAESTTQVVSDPSDLIPLSVLQLDLGEPPTGWATHLADRDIEIVLDDFGRLAIARDNARRLFAEKHENEARQREVAARNKQRAMEADQRGRAQLPSGTRWWEIPVGVSAAQVWVQAEKDATSSLRLLRLKCVRRRTRSSLRLSLCGRRCVMSLCAGVARGCGG